MKVYLFIIYICFFFLWQLEALAHGGGLNKEGCHNNRKTGDYHCHREKKNSIDEVSLKEQEIIVGSASVTDGDTIRIGKIRIRLYGIDAPESSQKCKIDGKEWGCGSEATQALIKIIGQKLVSCNRKGVDRYKRVIGVCRVDAIDLNAWMVINGWAVAYRRYSRDYVLDEQKAKESKKGIWQGHFTMPWIWRRR